MKNLLFLFGFMFLMHSCFKEHDDYESVDQSIQMNIIGKLINAFTHEPLRNIPLRIEQTGLDSKWNWVVWTVAQDRTQSDGSFHLNFKVSNSLELDFVKLKIDSILSNYQRGARINGDYNDIFCTIEGEGYPVKHTSLNYLIELFPTTKAYFVRPNIPAGWEQDTLFLNVFNLIESPNSQGWECLDTKAYPARFVFRLDNTQMWLVELRKVRNLFLGDQLDIVYTIRNGAVKKSGSFVKVCAIGDTTAVELPFW